MVIVPFMRPDEGKPRIGLLLPDGRVLDLQAAHVALRGTPSPHLATVSALRLAASYGTDLVTELAARAPASAVLSSA